eukprot:CAMPEP_0172542392 /NCGR_PEP_ID=MMETSP1067-20121228/13015_1 /TAXON_ID=265564 ORGANISM="Thalassiosira punctigera, Strain Tpunct2005C2" /NCGR_SAMPLE_ID=MMETSP1067 /ASSEMBLY_ACC=CAM_ASM_000444 /LENGTH=60 /DNA_ID=CAMNT_0013328625 /DNA_START=327 /DNA_END=509 /DNA_ORIENTATION=+
MKYASPNEHAGQTAIVLSTFFHASAPPSIESTFFRLAGYVLWICGRVIGREYGQVVHANM